MKLRMSIWLQNIGIACSISSFITFLFRLSDFAWLTTTIYHIPIFFSIIFLASLLIAEDVRKACKKLFFYEKRQDKRPIWQVGIGAIIFVAQIGIVLVFYTKMTQFQLGGMPLFLVFAFMNAFLATVIYEEVFK
ncbi:DNA polymerase I [Lysinibacillus piscis]|uniref:DNA polymerase I n=1 Tax=Lysinibacillus piscis TaxID=2518931 RepID=A0ABQ5NIY3_9BACI|nr:DNA polymerase I [Lysinibacillus sp. KH24]GLC88321.1 hypothetical protein LYSBPC_14480 [Lysinibacillus sp. KH24]